MLTHLTLARARRLLTAGRCAVGTVRHRYSSSTAKGRVISQSRKAGSKLPAGRRVNLTLSKGKKSRRSHHR